MISEYYAYREHPEVIRHIGGVLEVPMDLTKADVPVNHWCTAGSCRYAVKAPVMPEGTLCPMCGNASVEPLPF